MKAYVHTKIYTWMLAAVLFHNSPNLEKTQMSINKRTDKQIVVYPYNGGLLRNKKEQTTESFNNMDKCQNHYCEIKKTGQKTETERKEILSNSRKYKLFYSDRKQIQWLPGDWEERLGKNGLQRGTSKLFWVKDMFTVLTVVMVSKMYTYVKIQQIVQSTYI